MASRMYNFLNVVYLAYVRHDNGHLDGYNITDWLGNFNAAISNGTTLPPLPAYVDSIMATGCLPAGVIIPAAPHVPNSLVVDHVTRIATGLPIVDGVGLGVNPRTGGGPARAPAAGGTHGSGAPTPPVPPPHGGLGHGLGHAPGAGLGGAPTHGAPPGHVPGAGLGGAPAPGAPHGGLGLGHAPAPGAPPGGFGHAPAPQFGGAPAPGAPHGGLGHAPAPGAPPGGLGHAPAPGFGGALAPGAPHGGLGHAPGPGFGTAAGAPPLHGGTPPAPPPHGGTPYAELGGHPHGPYHGYGPPGHHHHPHYVTPLPAHAPPAAPPVIPRRALAFDTQAAALGLPPPPGPNYKFKDSAFGSDWPEADEDNVVYGADASPTRDSHDYRYQRELEVGLRELEQNMVESDQERGIPTPYGADFNNRMHFSRQSIMVKFRRAFPYFVSKSRFSNLPYHEKRHLYHRIAKCLFNEQMISRRVQNKADRDCWTLIYKTIRQNANRT